MEQRLPVTCVYAVAANDVVISNPATRDNQKDIHGLRSEPNTRISQRYREFSTDVAGPRSKAHAWQTTTSSAMIVMMEAINGYMLQPDGAISACGSTDVRECTNAHQRN